MNDRELMLRIKEDDRVAFKELYERYKNHLANFFHYLIPSRRDVVEDGIQDVFFKVWIKRKSYQPTARVMTYLFAIAKNYWFNEAKRLKKKAVSLYDDEKNTLDYIGAGQRDKIAGDLLRWEQVQAVQKAIADLPEKERMVLVLSEYQNMKYREIAEALDIAEITVKTRMAKAFQKLRNNLQRYLV